MNKSYTFTIVLEGIDENTPNIEDIIYNCGCNDALITWRGSDLYLDFDREAVSLSDAISSAIQSLHYSSLTYSGLHTKDVCTNYGLNFIKP